jgi:hypothetical protein
MTPDLDVLKRVRDFIQDSIEQDPTPRAVLGNLFSARDDIDALIAAARGGVPDGWKLVPVEIAPEMEAAWRAAFMSHAHKRRGSERAAGGFRRDKHPETAECVAYRAMLASAPAPPTKDQTDEA